MSVFIQKIGYDGSAIQFAIKHFIISICCLAFSMSSLCLSNELAGKRSQVTASLCYRSIGNIIKMF